jgi:flagellar capping protein FliD
MNLNPYSSQYGASYGIRNSVAGPYAIGGSYRSGNSYLSNLIKQLTNNAGDTGAETFNYLNTIKDASKSLLGALKPLTNASSFKQKTAVSSNPEYLTAVAKAGQNIKPFNVKIDQVAAGQINGGSYLNSAQKSFKGGIYQFEINKNGKNHQIYFELSGNEDNKTVQQKMADAVNAKNIGVKASVASSSDGKKSALIMESEETGDISSNVFTVKDVKGDAAQKSGADKTESEAKDAAYSIDGGETQYSHGNEISVNGVDLTLKQASPYEVEISAQSDPESAFADLESFIQSYNTLLTAAADNAGSRGPDKLYRHVMSSSATYGKSLANIGIDVMSDGSLSLNKEKAASAAENGSLERFFTENRRHNFGFVNAVSRTAENVRYNPGLYSAKSPLFLTNYAYTPQQSSSLTQMLNSGLIFDFTV